MMTKKEFIKKFCTTCYLDKDGYCKKDNIHLKKCMKAYIDFLKDSKIET